MEYDTIGFLEKTKKSFGIQMLRMMKNSQQKEYVKLFIEDEDEKQAQKNGRGRSGKRSVGIEFRNALSKLMADLKQTEPHYVRCIKPNELKSSQHFNGISVLRQLRCSGVLETIRIRSGGYPNRRPFKEFIQRYLVLAPHCNRKGGPRNVIDNMCQLLNIDKSQYRLGITKIFLKDQIFHKLEGQRNKLFTQSSTIIQTFYRGFSERMEFWLIKESAELLQFRLREYLKAADPSDEVKKILEILQTSQDEKEIVDNIMKLEKLGIRDKNVDIIADLGGVAKIIEVSKKFPNNHEIEVSCTRALARFSNNEENATKVARSGGVRQMVSNVKSKKYIFENNDDEKKMDVEQNKNLNQTQAESIELIDKLATVNRNVNIVIKERTVDALTDALNRKTNDDKQHIAAKALGTITKHRKAAMRIGRDEKAIETVLNSIRNKPQFGRMVTYSLNCVANLASTNKHNWESIVEMGGIDVAMLAFTNHVGNPSVIKEVGRLFAELCKNEQYAEMIADSGALELALKYMKKNPDACGVAAAKLVDDITRACPQKAAKILMSQDIDFNVDDQKDQSGDDGIKESGLSIICQSMNKMHTRPDISAALARTINNLCDISPKFVEGLAHCGAPQYILNALKAHPSLSVVLLHEKREKYIFPIDCVESLIKFANFDITFLDAIKQDGAVKAIALAMDSNPELSQLISLGADALRIFAEQDDLRHAMDIIARSRMEADSFEPKLIDQAISIVGNLVLIDVNQQYVVSEGGIAIFLSIVAGKIKPATANFEDAVVLASAVRALGRLINNVDNVAMWQEEGGIHTFEDIITNVSHSELVMNSICESIKNVLATAQGCKLIKEESQLLPLLISKVLKPHSEYKVCIPKIYEILKTNYFLNDSKYINTLCENGLIEGIKNHLEKNKQESEQVILSMNFITDLIKKQGKLTKTMVDNCARTIINTMKFHMKDKDALHSIYNCLYALIHHDPNIILTFKEYGFEQILAEILDQDDTNLDQEIFTETNTFLSTLISDNKIIAALDSANEIAQNLANKPNDIGLIEDLDKRLIFIANICGAENKYKTVIDNGGLILLPTCFAALNEAKDCLAREHAIKSCAFAAYKLGEFGNPSDIVEDGCYSQMADLYLNNVNYEGLADYLAKLTTFALKKQSLLPQLHEGNAVDANIAMIKNFPLKDDLCALAASNIAKLAMDSDTCQSIIQTGGIAAITEALSNMLISENTKEAINIFKSLDKMIKLVGDNDTVSISKYIDKDVIIPFIEAMKMREEPKLVEQALATVSLFCESDKEFPSKLVSLHGLNEVMKDLANFKGNSSIAAPAMLILSKCCAHADPKKLYDANIVQAISTNIKANPNDEIILSSGVASFATLAQFKDIFASQLINEDTLSVIASAVSARPRDIILTKALATYISNVVGDSGAPDKKIIDQLKQFGLIDILKTAATVHVDNNDVLPIIETAINCVDPKPENILKQLIANIDNESLVIQSLNDVLGKLLSQEDKPFDALLLTNALIKVNDKYDAKNTANQDVTKTLMDIVYEMSESPEYYGPLMQCGIVERLMNGTITDLTDIKQEDEEELLKDLELGVVNILNNLAMINDGKQYLNQIACQEVVVKNALNGIVMNQGIMMNDDGNGNGDNSFTDTDEQILLRSLRTIALLNDDNNANNYAPLISNGLIHTLQNIVVTSDNPLLAKEVFSMLENITTNTEQLTDNDFVDPETINTFVADYSKKFQNNPTVSQYCNNILTNIQPLIATAVVQQEPEPPQQPNIQQEMNMNVNVGPPPTTNVNAMVGQNVVAMQQPPPPPVPVIDAQVQFQQALDRRLDEEQKEKALIAFIDADLQENDIAMLVENHGVDKLVTTLAASRKSHTQQKLLNAIGKVTHKGDENFEHFIGAGGVGTLIKLMNQHLSADGSLEVLKESLKFVGEISANNHLRTVLGMHNIIQLMIKCIRENMKNVKVLDSCMYVLANLAYDNIQNMTQIIELGGVDDVFNVIKLHMKHVLLMRSCLDLLSNLMHNSNQNRVLICKGCKYILKMLQDFGGEDIKLAVSCFRCLGNLAYVPENVRKLVKADIIKIIVNSMTSNLKNDQCLQMGAAVLSNLASDPMISEKMIEQGVLGIILHISAAFPDLIELQKSCLGCLGNLSQNPQNCYTMIDNNCGKRILEILERIYFDDNIIKYSLSLIKILTINADVSTQFTRDGAAEIITRILNENNRKPETIRLCSQALCKCIQTAEASEIAGTQGVVDALCEIAKEGGNFANAPLMIDIMKVFQNMCQIEINAQGIARYAAIPILRGMETLKTNAIFMNVSATLVGNLAVYGSASKHLVKRGGPAVCMLCIKNNVNHQGVLFKLLRCISNLVLTEQKSYEKFVELEAIEIVKQIKQMYPNHKQINKCSDAFIRAMKLKSHKLQQDGTESKALKDKVDVKYIKYLRSGVMMKKYCSSAKPRKRLIKLTDNLEHILLIDPNGKKAPKQLYVRHITELRTGACTFTLRRSGLGWKKAKDERCFAIFTQDGSGHTNDLNLECKTVEIYEKWTNALQQLIQYAHEKSKINYT